MNLQSLFDIPEICHQFGVRQAVISPGSRNGALTISFSQHKKIECFSVPDERSAGFIALGMSLQTKLPTILICTSGSAGLNYFPAIAEAFFNRVPLLILTADRPKELIGIRDGQTIYQNGMFGKHIKASYELSGELEPYRTQETFIKALENSVSRIQGPVHLNIPFREPFYPNQLLSPSPIQYSGKSSPAKTTLDETLSFSEYKKIMIVVGQQSQDYNIESVLSKISIKNKIPVISDVIGNVHNAEHLIVHQDLILNHDGNGFEPDLLITTGFSVLSKNLKNILRKTNTLEHWHVDVNGDFVDTFGKLGKCIESDPVHFFENLLDSYIPSETQENFYNIWSKQNIKVKQKLFQLKFDSLTDILVYQKILQKLPDSIDLHLANSMAVRYVNYFGLRGKNNIEVFCNRGTSGIEGTNSTALGYAIVSEKQTILLTGDMAFLYDRNAFWHNHLPKNLKIIVINNGGGGIFRLIKGPSDHEELEPYFETDQRSNAEHLCKEYNIQYRKVASVNELDSGLKSFFTQPGNALLEIFTNKKENEKAFREMINFCS